MMQSANCPSSDSSLLVTAMIFNPSFFAALALLNVFFVVPEPEIAPFWENNNLRARGEALLPEEVDVFMETGVFGMEGKLNAGDAHLAVNYQRILSLLLSFKQSSSSTICTD